MITHTQSITSHKNTKDPVITATRVKVKLNHLFPALLKTVQSVLLT